MSYEDHLAKLVAVRGVSAAAIATPAGELVAGQGEDRAAVERLIALQTAALAAGRALGDLIPPLRPGAAEAGASDEHEDAAGGEESDAAADGGHLMAIYPEGPVLFVPMRDGNTVCVAVATQQDVGRVRFALRGLLAAVSQGESPVA